MPFTPAKVRSKKQAAYFATNGHKEMLQGMTGLDYQRLPDKVEDTPQKRAFDRAHKKVKEGKLTHDAVRQQT